MKNQKTTVCFAGIAMLILILDTKTSLNAVSEGITLCLQTLIPSLFPFLFLSAIIISSISERQASFLKPIGKLLKIPEGTESIFLMGLLGGYPTGAQCIAQAVKENRISRGSGKRMLAFCSNAGPSFIFGIGCRLFPEIGMCWALWAIHILSAMLVGIVMPKTSTQRGNSIRPIETDLYAGLRKAIATMAMICGWVILFRILLTFSQRWFLWLLPDWGQVMIAGLLELANGCGALPQISDVRLRFILCSGLLGFGGFCVAMQTYGVCKDIDKQWYLPGKILQALISMNLACMVISREMALPSFLILIVVLGSLLFFLRISANKDGIPQRSGV